MSISSDDLNRPPKQQGSQAPQPEAQHHAQRPSDAAPADDGEENLEVAPDADTEATEYSDESPPTLREDRGKWILVCGTGHSQLPRDVWLLCKYLGQSLANAGYKLVVGGRAGVDTNVGESFVNAWRERESRRGRLARPLSEDLKVVLFKGHQHNADWVTPIIISPGAQGTTEYVQMADVLIAIGGSGGTLRVYEEARQQGKPIIPVASTGGTASKVFNEAKLHSRLPGFDNANVEALTRSTESNEDAQSVASHLVALLDQLFAQAPRDAAPPYEAPGDEPRGLKGRWVMVAGTGDKELERPLLLASRKLGVALARAGLNLVVGGWPGVDLEVATAFADEFAPEDPALAQRMRVLQFHQEPTFNRVPTTPMQATPNDHEGGVAEAVGMAEAFILLGGMGSTRHVGEAARRQRKPVLPLAGTGGDARTIFDEIMGEPGEFALPELEPARPELEPGLSKSEFEKLSRPINSGQDAELVAKQAIHLLKRLWNPPRQREPAFRASQGATVLRRKDVPPPQTPEPVHIVRETLRERVVAELSHEPDKHTLGVHLMPRLSPQAQAMAGSCPNVGAVGAGGAAGEEWKYQVVLSVREELDGQSGQRLYEGPLCLRASTAPPGEQRGRELLRALFHEVVPERHDPDRVTEPPEGRPSPTLRGGYDWAKARSEREGEVLRLQVRINTDAPDLHRERWEDLWDERDGMALACNDRVAFSRVLHVSDHIALKPLPLNEGSPLRVLGAIAGPNIMRDPQSAAQAAARFPELRGLAPVADVEASALQASVQRLSPRVAPLQGESLLGGPQVLVGLEDLRQRLALARDLNRPFHVLHLLCHGLVRSDGSACLLLDNPSSGDVDFVTEEKFAGAMREFRDTLRLIVLASCFTAQPTQGHALNGIARRLVERGSCAVVAMQDRLELKAAQHFTQRLYASLTGHGQVDRAVNAARRELYQQRILSPDDLDPQHVEGWQWGVPVLFMNVPDGKLFDVAAGNPAPERNGAGPRTEGGARSGDSGAVGESGPEFQTHALPLEALPGANPSALSGTMLHAALGGLGVSLPPSALAELSGRLAAHLTAQPGTPQDGTAVGGLSIGSFFSPGASASGSAP